MKKGNEIIINVLFWILTAWLLTSSYSIQQQEIEIINGIETVKIVRNAALIIELLTLIIICILMFYGNLWLILKLKFTSKPKWTILWSILIFSLSVFIYYSVELIPVFPAKPPLPVGLHWGIAIFYYAISTTYGISKLWQHSEKSRHRLALEKKQAELSLLRSQLQPHFLFNTLNNLLAMVDQQRNPLLADALDRLSGLLRYVVYETSSGNVSVKKEIDFIRNYSELQRLRYEQHEVRFNLIINGIYDQQLIEPGIFIPFVENAFKYGTAPEKESQIEIEFDLTEKSGIIFKATNTIHSELNETRKSGTGIQSNMERLNLVYPQRHDLKILKDDHFIVELQIRTDESNNHR